MNTPSNNHPNHAGHESVLTMADIQAAAMDYKASTTDPLDRFPDLQEVAVDTCRGLAMQLMDKGVPAPLAQATASRAYALATVASLSMHRAVWNAVLPDPGNLPA